MKDKEFLLWLHARLADVHNENPLVDYMHKLRAIINDMPEDQETPNDGRGECARKPEDMWIVYKVKTGEYLYLTSKEEWANHIEIARGYYSFDAATNAWRDQASKALMHGWRYGTQQYKDLKAVPVS